MTYARLSVLALAAVMALPVFADVVDDCIRLAQGGVGEEVIVAWVERQGSADLSAADVLRMKDGKVPDRAIAALLRVGVRAPMRQMPQTQPQQQPRYQTQEAPIQTVAVPRTVSYEPATRYVYSEPTSYVYPSTYYYGGSPYYSSCYNSYPYYSSGVGLSFSFGNGGYYGNRYYGGYSNGYCGSYRGGYYGGYSSNHGGYYGGYSSGIRGGFSGGFSGGYRSSRR
ncbi:MAG: hypothetical protein WCT04_04815 [Planctomycetota bacterium]